jgi:hypothetical protein
MAEQHDSLSLDNERMRAALSDADIVGRMHYWAAALHNVGLHAEGLVMSTGANEILLLRAQLHAHLKDSRRRKAV